MADELAVLELQVTAHKFASMTLRQPPQARLCLHRAVRRAVRCDGLASKSKTWEVSGCALPFAMLRGWSYKLGRGQCSSIVFQAAASALPLPAWRMAIKAPEQTKPVSLHEKLNRVRPERLEIRYDVAMGTATQKKTLPFVVGIIGDVCGDSTAVRTLSNRRFITVDRDNLQTCIKELGDNSSPRGTQLNGARSRLRIEGGSAVRELGRLSSCQGCADPGAQALIDDARGITRVVLANGSRQSI